MGNFPCIDNVMFKRNIIEECVDVGFSLPLYLFLLFCVFHNCDKSNPTQSSSTMTLIGDIGSQRTYRITEKWFEPHTDIPYAQVPDSLIVRISLSDSLRESGVVYISNVIEDVVALDSVYYNSLQLTTPISDYKMSDINGPMYSIFRDMECLNSNIPYIQGITGGIYFWYETDNEVQQVTATEHLPMFPAHPWVKKPLVVGQTWIRYQQVDTSTGEIIHQKNVKVMNKEYITVGAGTFLACKLAIYWSSVLPELTKEFEYYVPNVGLVLYINDHTSYVAYISPNGGGTTTIYRRSVERKELVSANIIE